MKKILLLIICTTIINVYADQNIQIIGGNTGNPKLAVMQFTNDSANSIANEVNNDFSISGDFVAKTYSQIDKIDPATQYIIKGSLKQNSSGLTTINYILTNALDDSTILNQSASFQNKDLRKAVHAIDDIIYQKLTSYPSVFQTKIALATRNGDQYSLVIADYDGFNPKTLLTTKRPLSSLAWDRNGQYISYVSYESGKPIVYVQSIYQGNRYIVANFNGSNSSPSFTPNGNQLAVTLSKDYGSHIYLIDNHKYINGISASNIINFGTIDTEADISANGQLAFTSDHDGGPQIFTSDLNGTSPLRVTNGLGNYNTSAKFSNDGTKLTFVNRSGGNFQAYIWDFKTQSAYPISQNISHALAPSFAPNDRLVLFSNEDNLYIANTTGTIQTKLNNVKYAQIIDQKWSKN